MSFTLSTQGELHIELPEPLMRYVDSAVVQEYLTTLIMMHVYPKVSGNITLSVRASEGKLTVEYTIALPSDETALSEDMGRLKRAKELVEDFLTAEAKILSRILMFNAIRRRGKSEGRGV